MISFSIHVHSTLMAEEDAQKFRKSFTRWVGNESVEWNEREKTCSTAIRPTDPATWDAIKCLRPGTK